jgi:CheY-like chemotaxis protein
MEGPVAVQPSRVNQQQRGAHMAKILVVEDEAIVRLLVVDTLKNCGHTVLEAADGQTALELIRQCPDLDMLVSDIRLPKMDGFSLAGAARQLLPGLRLLFLTGYLRTVAPAELSPVVIVEKPFDSDNLANQVAAVLDAKRR